MDSDWTPDSSPAAQRWRKDTSKIAEPPDGTRIEFQEYGSKGGDLIAIKRNDAASAEAGWTTGDGGEVWCEYGYSVPMTWAAVLADPRLAACVNGLRLVPEADLAAAEARGRAEGWAEALRAFFQRAIADTMKEQRGE